MPDTIYIDLVTLIVADSMNDFNRLHYTIFSDPADMAAVKASLHAAPGAIGGTTPAAVACTTLTASGAVSGSTITGSGVVAGAAAAAAGNMPRADQIQAQSLISGTTSGSSTAYTLNLPVDIADNAEWIEVDVKFHTAAGTTPTLAVDGKTALAIKYRDSTGALQAATSTQIPSGWRSKCVCDGTYWVMRDVPVLESDVKTWLYCVFTAGVPGVTAAKNVASITDNGTGDIQINMTTSFASTNYAVVFGSCFGVNIAIPSTGNRGYGQCQVLVYSGLFALSDRDFSVFMAGAQ